MSKMVYSPRMFEPPLAPSYSAMYLPDGSLTIFGRKYLLKKKAEEMKQRRLKAEKAKKADQK